MTWARLAIWLSLLAVGGGLGYIYADWTAEDTRVDLANLKADIRVITATANGQTALRKSESAEARKVIVGLLDRLERAREKRGAYYRERTKILERLPADQVCFDADARRVLLDATDARGLGLADSLDTRVLVDRAAADAAPSGGSSVRAVGQWITEAMRAVDDGREQINAFAAWARGVDGKCGCLKIE